MHLCTSCFNDRFLWTWKVLLTACQKSSAATLNPLPYIIIICLVMTRTNQNTLPTLLLLCQAHLQRPTLSPELFFTFFVLVNFHVTIYACISNYCVCVYTWYQCVLFALVCCSCIFLHPVCVHLKGVILHIKV